MFASLHTFSVLSIYFHTHNATMYNENQSTITIGGLQHCIFLFSLQLFIIPEMYKNVNTNSWSQIWI